MKFLSSITPNLRSVYTRSKPKNVFDWRNRADKKQNRSESKLKRTNVEDDGSGNWVCVLQLPFWCSPSTFMQLAESMGEVLAYHLSSNRTTGLSNGYGFVRYKNEDGANKAINTLNGLNLAYCDWNLRCVPVEIEASTFPRPKSLFLLLPGCGCRIVALRDGITGLLDVPPSYCYLAPGLQGLGFADFPNPDDAEVAQATLHDATFAGVRLYALYAAPGTSRTDFQEIVPKEREPVLRIL